MNTSSCCGLALVPEHLRCIPLKPRMYCRPSGWLASRTRVSANHILNILALVGDAGPHKQQGSRTCVLRDSKTAWGMAQYARLLGAGNVCEFWRCCIALLVRGVMGVGGFKYNFWRPFVIPTKRPVWSMLGFLGYLGKLELRSAPARVRRLFEQGSGRLVFPDTL